MPDNFVIEIVRVSRKGSSTKHGLFHESSGSWILVHLDQKLIPIKYDGLDQSIIDELAIMIEAKEFPKSGDHSAYLLLTPDGVTRCENFPSIHDEYYVVTCYYQEKLWLPAEHREDEPEILLQAYYDQAKLIALSQYDE